jgi:hypothetical protein
MSLFGQCQSDCSRLDLGHLGAGSMSLLRRSLRCRFRFCSQGEVAFRWYPQEVNRVPSLLMQACQLVYLPYGALAGLRAPRLFSLRTS